MCVTQSHRPATVLRGTQSHTGPANVLCGTQSHIGPANVLGHTQCRHSPSQLVVFQKENRIVLWLLKWKYIICNVQVSSGKKLLLRILELELYLLYILRIKAVVLALIL